MKYLSQTIATTLYAKHLTKVLASINPSCSLCRPLNRSHQRHDPGRSTALACWLFFVLTGPTLVFTPLKARAQDCRIDCNNAYQTTWHGIGTLENNHFGYANSAFGQDALQYNTDGDNNTGIGAYALGNNATGSNNTALGFVAAGFESSTSNNTLLGYESGEVNVGSANTGVGVWTLWGCQGNDNAAVGEFAGYNSDGSFCVAVGESP